MNQIIIREKELKEFLWKNKIIKWGFFIDLCPTGSSKKILGLNINFLIRNNKLIIVKNEEKNYSSLFLTLISWTSETIKINDKEIKENKEWEDMVKLFKKINSLDYFDKEIELDEECKTYVEFCSPYLISPYRPDQYFIDRDF